MDQFRGGIVTSGSDVLAASAYCCTSLLHEVSSG
jgi:hypothetical protein